jgi:16S rRNA (uracil1498-N3)-methyltransferase
MLVANAQRVLVVIGPEGGFSHAEAQAAQDAGAQLISLGTRILRTETAALVVISIIAYLTENRV